MLTASHAGPALTMSNCFSTSSAFIGGPLLSPRNAQQSAWVSGGKTTQDEAHMPPQLTGSGPGLRWATEDGR